MTRTRIIVVLAAAAFAVAIQSASAQPAHPAKRAEPADALIGTWDTGPIPAAELRSTFRRAGYTTWAVARFFHAFGIDKTFEFKLVFYRVHGTLFQIRRSWDPPESGQMPTGGDRGPCRLLGGHRFTVSNIGPATDGIRATFALCTERGQAARPVPRAGRAVPGGAGPLRPDAADRERVPVVQADRLSSPEARGAPVG